MSSRMLREAAPHGRGNLPSPQPSPHGRGSPAAAVEPSSPLPWGEGQGEGLSRSFLSQKDAAAPRPSPTRSLRRRLIWVSLAWLAFSLLATGAVLLFLFRAQMQRHFDETLKSHLEELTAAAEAGNWRPASARYQAPSSGWYWEIRAGGKTLERSPSLAGLSLPAEAPPPGARALFDNVPGPWDIRIKILAQTVLASEGKQALAVLVAGPCLTVRSDVLTFLGQLIAALLTLGLTLGALIAAQVTFGLRPLSLVRSGLEEVRLGRRPRLKPDGPAEIAPLIDEVNGLLDERDAMVRQARAEAGNLAHALKTPIAVIRNEAAAMDQERGAILKAETDRMARVVEHHLVAARAQVRERAGAEASVDRVLEDVRFSLERVYPEKRLEIEAPRGLAAACAEDDLGEMIGNLADNACKWAKSAVRISAARAGGRILFSVDDDGAGLSEEEQAKVLARGERLDESMPGHGLGLSIVAKLAAMRGGKLRLGRSRLGGLSAQIELPEAKGKEA
jgi:signal transduction histidine kinase